MSGLEAPVVATGGRLLAPLAATASRALVKKLTFRWAVSHRVRARTEFQCDWKVYRKWLKTITIDELSNPIVEIQGTLANRLDEALCASGTHWSDPTDHLSRALRLVELTYPAIAATIEDADRAQLCESWAQQRDATVRKVLYELAGPDAAFSAQDLAQVLRQRSAARRTVRLQAFNTDEAALRSYLERIHMPNVPSGSVVVLQGDFGSGKSEVAETWHRACINELAMGDIAPIPVWFNASAMTGMSLENALDAQTGHAWRRGQGASITIDGLDEIEPATAQALLDASRVLAKTYTSIRVLLTSRPGILTPTTDEEQAIDLLSASDALDLVEAIGGERRETWRWTTDMRETVRRPFFALAAGIMLASGSVPDGEADLIRNLVEHALATGAERQAVTSSTTRGVLEKLAVRLTHSGRDGLSFSDRQVARSSRLVADGPQGSVIFSLPIFQHWFAAQAILAGDVPPEDIVATRQSFVRWRWAAAVAVMSLTDDSQIDELLGTWVSGNPGAAAWIIREAFSGRGNFHTDADGSLDAISSRRRILRALRTWTNGLGPFAPGLLPDSLVHGPVGLGVAVSGRCINIAFAEPSPKSDYVTELPEGIHPLSWGSISKPAWIPWMCGGVPRGSAWPWTMTRELIARETLKKLSNDPHLGTSDGIWTQERRFDLSRVLLRRGRQSLDPLPADEVRTRAVELFESLGGNRKSSVTFNLGGSYSGAELEDLILSIDTNRPSVIASPLPQPDLNPPPPSSWIWEWYSQQRIMEFEVAVYSRACKAYDEALDNAFARLGWSMSSSILAPFGVVMRLNLNDDDSERRLRDRWGSISLSLTRVPMALLPELAPTDPEPIWSTDRRVVISRSEVSLETAYFSWVLERIGSWLQMQERELIGGLSWSTTIANQMSKVRPACDIAAKWLYDDLKKTGLGEGTFPQLR